MCEQLVHYVHTCMRVVAMCALLFTNCETSTQYVNNLPTFVHPCTWVIIISDKSAQCVNKLSTMFTRARELSQCMQTIQKCIHCVNSRARVNIVDNLFTHCELLSQFANKLSQRVQVVHTLCTCEQKWASCSHIVNFCHNLWTSCHKVDKLFTHCALLSLIVKTHVHGWTKVGKLFTYCELVSQFVNKSAHIATTLMHVWT